LHHFFPQSIFFFFHHQSLRGFGSAAFPFRGRSFLTFIRWLWAGLFDFCIPLSYFCHVFLNLLPPRRGIPLSKPTAVVLVFPGAGGSVLSVERFFFLGHVLRPSLLACQCPFGDFVLMTAARLPPKSQAGPSVVHCSRLFGHSVGGGGYCPLDMLLPAKGFSGMLLCDPFTPSNTM